MGRSRPCTPDEGVPPIDPGKAAFLPLDPDEEPCPIDPRGGRAAPAPLPGLEPAAMSARHGSEKRQREVVLTARFAADEARTVRQLAADRGESIGTMLRTTLLGIHPPRRRRRPRPDDHALSQLLGELARVRAELGKSGSNLNQIAHYLNADRSLQSVAAMLEAALHEHDEAMRTLLELRGAALQAMGLGGQSDPDRET